MTNADVISLVEAQLGDEIVVAKIRQCPNAAFDTSTDALVEVKQRRVSNAVIQAMLAWRGTSDSAASETQGQPGTSRATDASSDKKTSRFAAGVKSFLAAAADPLSVEPKEPVEGVTSPAFARARITRMAIIGEAGNDYNSSSNGVERLIEDEFLQAIMSKGYSVASRSDVAALLKESRFQHSGLTDADVTRMGKLLNVTAVLVVTVNSLNVDRQYSGGNTTYTGRVNMGARLLHVETGEVLWIARESRSSRIASESDSLELVRREAARLAKAFPPTP